MRAQRALTQQAAAQASAAAAATAPLQPSAAPHPRPIGRPLLVEPPPHVTCGLALERPVPEHMRQWLRGEWASDGAPSLSCLGPWLEEGEEEPEGGPWACDEQAAASLCLPSAAGGYLESPAQPRASAFSSYAILGSTPARRSGSGGEWAASGLPRLRGAVSADSWGALPQVSIASASSSTQQRGRRSQCTPAGEGGRAGSGGGGSSRSSTTSGTSTSLSVHAAAAIAALAPPRGGRAAAEAGAAARPAAARSVYDLDTAVRHALPFGRGSESQRAAHARSALAARREQEALQREHARARMQAILQQQAALAPAGAAPGPPPPPLPPLPAAAAGGACDGDADLAAVVRLESALQRSLGDIDSRRHALIARRARGRSLPAGGGRQPLEAGLARGAPPSSPPASHAWPPTARRAMPLLATAPRRPRYAARAGALAQPLDDSTLAGDGVWVNAAARGWLCEEAEAEREGCARSS